MKNKIWTFILIIGIIIVLYPVISKVMSKEKQQKEIENYRNKVENLEDDNYIDFLKVGEVIGYIEIEKINVLLPIYEGSSDDVLAKGVGHITKTDLPLGEKYTHSMLAGHTGYTKAKIFDDIDRLEINDKFFIHIMNNKTEYIVDEIKIVEADYQEELYKEEDNAYVTLVTCTPQILNNKRLLIRGVKF